MASLSLRLMDDIGQRLAQEAQAEGKSRSEVARAAIAELLDRRERERFMAEMVEEMRQAYADPEIRREALEIAEDTILFPLVSLWSNPARWSPISPAPSTGPALAKALSRPSPLTKWRRWSRACAR